MTSVHTAAEDEEPQAIVVFPLEYRHLAEVRHSLAPP